jgi:hypothetical protein
VESRLGVRLPSEFAAFLLNYNAGEVRPAAPAPLDKLVPLCEDIEWGFHPVGDDSDMVAEFERAHRLNLRDLEGDLAAVMRELVPLARVNDDDWLLLGVAGGRNGKVYFFNGHDYDWFDPNGLSERAESLPRFLATLTARWVHA